MSKFLKRWTTDVPEFAGWLLPDPANENNARCKLCAKTFSLSNMGLCAIRSHQSSKGHKNASAEQSQRNLASFFSPTPTVVTTTTANSDVTCTSSEAASTSFVKPVEGTRAEVLWACKCVASHYSYRSMGDIGQVLRAMFPDSGICAQFSMSYDKTAYVVAFGLAPYLKCQLERVVSKAPEYVVCFDEALNKIAQKCQLDLVVRFWDESSSRVATRYLTSVFLSNATAVNLFEAFKLSLQQKGLSLNRLLQVSMDGPNVNWCFFRKLKEDMDLVEGGGQLLDLGSCGLHVINGAFQTGHRQSKWGLSSFLRSVYYLFKDSPARRAAFTRISGDVASLKKFCGTRWTENSDAVSRCVQLLSSLRKYVREVNPKPANQSFQTVADAVGDALLEAKLEFFKSAALNVEPFLVKFQTERPMAPLLFDSLQQLVVTLLNRFIKQDVIRSANTASKLLQIDVSPTSANCCILKELDVGFGANRCLKQAKVSDLQRMQFRGDCRSFLSSMVAKIFERSPLKFAVVRAISCVSPKVITQPPTIAASRMKRLLEVLVESNIIAPTAADNANTQFNNFLSDQSFQSSLKEFNDARGDVSQLYILGMLRGCSEYDSLWQIVRKVLVLSHGNASVESGFSINRDILVENLSEESVVAQRIVYDAIKVAGGPLKIDTTTTLLQHVRTARSRYRDALEARRKSAAKETNAVRERKRAAQELNQLQAKKQQMEVQAASDIKAMDLRIKELQRLSSAE